MDPRYSRQLVLPGFGTEAQSRLAQARVLVVGAGGLGSAVLPALAAAGVGTIDGGSIGIVDDDLVELSNLHRQTIHGTEDVGNFKTTSAIESMRANNPTLVAVPFEERLNAENALGILREFDLVIDGSDNFPTRYLVADAATILGIPLVWGAVSQYGGQASVALPGGPGYRDLFPSPPPPGSVASCEVGGVLPTTVGVIGAIMATEAIKLLTGLGTALSGRVTTYDALSGSFRELAFERDPSAQPVTDLIDYELFCGFAPGGHEVDSAQLAAELAGEGVTLIDVREPWEAEIASLSGAQLIPLGQLPGAVAGLDRSGRFVAYCHHGIRSAQALRILLDAGLDARHLAGGIDAWAVDRDPGMTRY